MTMRTNHAWSWMDDGVPSVAMFMVTCLDMAVLTVTKAAMNDGLGSIVYVIYHNALGVFILLPCFVVHIIRNHDRPPLTFRIMFIFFILGLLGICLFQVIWYIGVGYSSPTMASAIGNLSPGITFLIAVLFRTEKLDIRSSSSIAKLLGTLITVSGATVITFYQGPRIFRTVSSDNKVFLQQASNWILGSMITLTGMTFACVWSVLQTRITREYRDQQAIIFFSVLLGTIQCIALSPFVVQTHSDWDLRSGIKVTAIVFGAVYSTAVRNNVLTWCLRKKGPVFVAMFSPLSIVLALIMGVTFLGDSLHLGSIIGATIVASGFYMVMWGQVHDKNKILVVIDDDLNISHEHVPVSDQTTHLLSSRNESEC